MSEKNNLPPVETSNETVDRIAGFWEKSGKQILIGLGVLVVVVGGFFLYKTQVSEPNEKKASEALRFGEEAFRMDSARLALNGDGINPGLLKVISKYSGTKAGNLAEYYAGSCYLQLGDFPNAIKHLNAFSTSELLLKARAKALAADANSELGKNDEAIRLYKEAGTTFEKDDHFSPQYLFRAAFLEDKLGKTKDAIATYKMIKDKYPSFRDFDIDKYLGRLGETAE